MIFIYGLICPVKNTVRYIGKTINLEQRLKAHIIKARTNQTAHHCARWINSLLRAGLDPSIQTLYVVKEGEDWQDCESRLIKQHLQDGYPLTNMTTGGDGFHDLPPESIQKRVERRKITMAEPAVKAKWVASRKRLHESSEYKAKLSYILKNLWSDDERRQSFISSMNTPKAVENRSIATIRRFENKMERQRLRDKMKRAFNTPEAREAQSIRSRRAWSDPDRRKKRIQSIRTAYKNPELLEKMAVVGSEIGSRPEVKTIKSKKAKAMWENNRQQLMESFSCPEVKKVQSEKRKAAWANPETGERLRAIHASSESRKKKSDAAKARNTPEYRALMAEKTRLAWEKRRSKK